MANDTSTDVFKIAFFTIDEDLCGTIHESDLRRYMKEKSLEHDFVQKWMKLFDRQNTGEIRLEEFCEVLGLEIKEVKEEQHHHHKKLPRDVSVVSTSMSVEQQINVVFIAKHLLDSGIPLREISETMKRKLDVRFERLWHVIIAKGQYWSFYSHDPPNNIIFKIGQYIFLVWRTPI